MLGKRIENTHQGIGQVLGIQWLQITLLDGPFHGFFENCYGRQVFVFRFLCQGRPDGRLQPTSLLDEDLEKLPMLLEKTERCFDEDPYLSQTNRALIQLGIEIGVNKIHFFKNYDVINLLLASKELI